MTLATPTQPSGATVATASAKPRWLERSSAYWARVNAIDFALGALLVLNNYTIGPAPFGVVLSGLIIAVAAFRRPTVHVRWGGVLYLLGSAVFGYLILVSIDQGQPWAQRSFRFFLILTVAAVVAQRRIDPMSFFAGAAISPLFNALAFYAGVAPNNYPPYLSGFYNDKNVAGFYYALIGILGLLAVPRRWTVPWLALSSALLFLTGSRTSMMAFALAVAWLLLRNRLGMTFRLAAAAAGVWMAIFIETQFAQIGVFSDRVGTDWYREQIDAATEVKVGYTPPTGLGLNQGFVILQGGRRAFMHDSYAQAFVEGGYVFLYATILAFGVLALGPLSRRVTVPRPLLVAEAATVVILVCGWKLGEVFMTTGAFIVLGLAIGARFGEEPRLADRWWAAP
ncbi:hypothetical protein FB554_2233 [Barrientosiimonas humi]|uniref:O-antigen ligase n=1 Tax=Barrientosiimonas humi TaxID=999931 RepID=A0A542XE10_9MICO|nr:zinc ABC transporter permease [Barrientosiimonas humi]TQL34075.1 hypothetical protein FB554_2233 [Barrientosiimonas humi]CAG7574065.1 hypothetical protein BH39T_PBIAJDOK_02708 [Barrientosiimonas humi]